MEYKRKEVYPRSKMEEDDEMYYLNNASTDCSRKLLTGSLCNNQDTLQRPVWGICYDEFGKRKTWGLHLQVQVYPLRWDLLGVQNSLHVFYSVYAVCFSLIFVVHRYQSGTTWACHSVIITASASLCLIWVSLRACTQGTPWSTSQITLPVACTIIPIMEYTRMSKVHWIVLECTKSKAVGGKELTQKHTHILNKMVGPRNSHIGLCLPTRAVVNDSISLS